MSSTTPQQNEESNSENVMQAITKEITQMQIYAPFGDYSAAFFGRKFEMDQTLRLLLDLVYKNLPVENNSDIEIEAKIGKLMNLNGDQRIFLPVKSESVVVDSGSGINFRFVSEIEHTTFIKLNKLLNHQFTQLHEAKDKQHYQGPLITYSKPNEIDLYVKLASGIKNYSEKIRVSIDSKTREPKYALKKVRLANFDVYCPNAAYDFRISVSREQVVELPNMKMAIVDHERRKDRLSYGLGHAWKLDMTTVKEVKMDNYGNPKEKDFTVTYELELECNTRFLVQEKQRLIEKKPNLFEKYVSCLLQNMRVLVRQATDTPHHV